MKNKLMVLAFALGMLSAVSVFAQGNDSSWGRRSYKYDATTNTGVLSFCMKPNDLQGSPYSGLNSGKPVCFTVVHDVDGNAQWNVASGASNLKQLR